jgi:hypothetical protein
MSRLSWSTIRWDWIAAAISLVLMTWMVTEGEWNLFGTTGYLEGFYDAQAESFLAGHADVAPDAILTEAFLRDGKAYGYFGPTPALLRLPLVLFPGMKGHWSRCSMLLACIVTLATLFLLLRNAEALLPALRQKRLWRALRPVIVLAAAIGSTNFYLIAESKVYQESIMWGGTLAFAAAVILAWYLTHRQERFLALACALAFLAFFARVSSGAGPIFALLLIDLALILPFPQARKYWAVDSAPRRGRAIAMISATVVATAVLWAALNHWKFGAWFVSQPIELNQEYTPERVAHAKGELASLTNLPLTFFAYLAPSHISFKPRFPWIFAVLLDEGDLTKRFPNSHFDKTDVIAALPWCVPEFLFGAAAAMVLTLSKRGSALRAWRAPLSGALAGCSLIFCWGFLTQRYFHDMFPWLVIGGVGALAWSIAEARPTIRRLAAGAFAAATVWAMWTNFAVALMQQRFYTGPISLEKRLSMADLSYSTADSGLSGLLLYLTSWRVYVSAASFQSGNLTADPTLVPRRPNQPGARSEGAPPYSARYVIETPAEGEYELSIRYASSTPHPVFLAVNGQIVGQACAVATGGSTNEYLKWSASGRYHLQRGAAVFDLASNNEFPVLHALRLVRLD